MLNPTKALKEDFTQDLRGEAFHRAVKEDLELDGIVQDAAREGVLSKGLGDQRWTPAHVAVIAGHAKQLGVIAKARGDLQAKDHNGFTPMEYAIGLRHKECERVLRKRPIAPHVVDARREAQLKQMLPKTIEFAHRESSGRAPDDFQKPLDRIFVCCRSNFEQPFVRDAHQSGRSTFHISTSLLELCERVGIVALETMHGYTPRDPWFLMSGFSKDRLVLIAQNPTDQFDKALQRVTSYQFMNGEHLSCRAHPLFMGHHGATRNFKEITGGDAYLHLGSGSSHAPNLYMEGGDLFQLTNGLGDQVFLSSRMGMNLTHTLSRLDPEGILREEGIQAEMEELDPPEVKSMEGIHKLLGKLYYLGHIKQKARSGSLSDFEKAQLIASIEKRPLGKQEIPAHRAAKLKLVSEFNPDNAHEMKGVAIKYAKQRLALSHFLMRATDSTQLSELSSPFAHLDSWVMPGPHSTLFYADPSYALHLLRHLKVNADVLELTDVDKRLLDEYCEVTARMMDLLRRPIAYFLDDVKGSGFQAIPIAGIFYKEKGCVNFMNALTGMAGVAPNRRQIIATLGAEEGDKLGGLLMDAFAIALKGYTDGDLYFLGEDASRPGTFPESLSWMSEGTGVHCMTKEVPNNKTEGGG